MSNATLQIKNMTLGAAVFRSNENIRAGAKWGEANIEVLVNNSTFRETPKKEIKKLDADEKKERVQLQKNLHIYKKRLSKAIEENKQKSIQTNQNKINEIEFKLNQRETRKHREKKEFVELKFTLPGIRTNDKNFNRLFSEVQTKYINKYFGDLKLITNAIHLDQHSLHSHAIFRLPDNVSLNDYLGKKFNIEKINNNKYYTYEQREKIYQQQAREWHSFAKKHLEIDFKDLKYGERYVPINKYKEMTEFNQRKDALNKINEDFIEETNDMYENFLASFDKKSSDKNENTNNDIIGNLEKKSKKDKPK